MPDLSSEDDAALDTAADELGSVDVPDLNSEDDAALDTAADELSSVDVPQGKFEDVVVKPEALVVLESDASVVLEADAFDVPEPDASVVLEPEAFDVLETDASVVLEPDAFIVLEANVVPEAYVVLFGGVQDMVVSELKFAGVVQLRSLLVEAIDVLEAKSVVLLPNIDEDESQSTGILFPSSSSKDSGARVQAGASEEVELALIVLLSVTFVVVVEAQSTA